MLSFLFLVSARPCLSARLIQPFKMNFWKHLSSFQSHTKPVAVLLLVPVCPAAGGAFGAARPSSRCWDTSYVSVSGSQAAVDAGTIILCSAERSAQLGPILHLRSHVIERYQF